MEVEGIYTINPGTDKEFSLKNALVSDGAEYFLRTIFRGEAILPATYYIGLTNVNPGFAGSSLVAVNAGEPAVAHGYARQAAVKNTVDWTVTFVNGAWRAQSKVVTFTVSSDYVTSWNRLFLCNVNAGTGGLVFSLSGPAPALILPLLADGNFTAQFSFWMRP